MTVRPADAHGEWVLWSSDFGRERLYLPPRVVSKLEADQQRRENDRRELLRMSEECSRIDREAAVAEMEAAKAAGKHIIGKHQPHAHEVGQHPVLPRLHEVEMRLRRLEDGVYGDKDLVARQQKALELALQRGAMRSVARRSDWRQALDQLSIELPAFRAVVDVIANAFALAEAAEAMPSVPPILIVGAPGVGKSFFCRRLAQTLGGESAWIGMDQHSAGSELRGSDSHWSTSKHGVLFELLGLGYTANPLIVLDEIDKASRSVGSHSIDMLAQLYSALEPETARHLVDVSLDVELDASLVNYIATANQLKSLDAPLLSRFEVVQVGLPNPAERREAAARVIEGALQKLGVSGAVKVSSGCTVLLAEFSARVVHRAVEKAVGAAVSRGRDKVSISDIEEALGLAAPRLAPHERHH